MIPPGVKAAARWMLAAVILFFLIYGLAANWEKLRQQNVSIRYAALLLSVLWNVGFLAVQAVVWRQCLSLLGHKIPRAAAGSIWINSQLSKYVPGKVMLLIVRALYGERVGVPKSTTILSIYLELVLMLVTGTSVFLLFGGDLFSKLESFRIPSFLPPLLVAAGIAGLHPRILNLSVNLGLRLIKKPPVRFDISFLSLLLLAIILLGGWLFHGLAALATVRAVGIEPGAGLFLHTGFFALSWVLGFLSFLTPGGIGVREGVLALALATIYPMEIAIAVSLLSRLSWVFAEILMAGALFPAAPKARAAA